MNYDEAVQYIHSLLKFGMNLGLERITQLLSALGNPQNDLKFIHIAGTNGKGSTSTMMSEILKSAGYKTGLFTSPYVFSFCERIQINNSNIDKQKLAQITLLVKNTIDSLNIEITEFEAITAIALVYFRNEKCDYVVLEVGLGGRYDSTNVIPCPEVAIITSISLDHTKVLGNTIPEIAKEKCGIIKHGGSVVTTSLQNKEALETMINTVKKEHGRLTIPNIHDVKVLSEDITGTVIDYDDETYKINLVGSHQVENAIGVIEAARQIKGVTYENIKAGIENTVMHGRMEIVKKNPLVMLEGGHNEECSLALSNVVSKYIHNDITAVIGMMADKDCNKYLSNILPLCKRVIFTKPDNPRSASTEELKEYAKQYITDIEIIENPEAAYSNALEVTGKKGTVLVCGSFYLLSDIFKK